MKTFSIQRPPLTIHPSPLTTHHSPLTTHHSPLTRLRVGQWAARQWPGQRRHRWPEKAWPLRHCGRPSGGRSGGACREGTEFAVHPVREQLPAAAGAKGHRASDFRIQRSGHHYWELFRVSRRRAPALQRSNDAGAAAREDRALFSGHLHARGVAQNIGLRFSSTQRIILKKRLEYDGFRSRSHWVSLMTVCTFSL